MKQGVIDLAHIYPTVGTVSLLIYRYFSKVILTLSKSFQIDIMTNDKETYWDIFLRFC